MTLTENNNGLEPKATGALANIPYAIDQTVKGAGNAILWSGHIVQNTLEATGESFIWGVQSIGRVAQVTTGVALATVCYPLSAITAVLGTVSTLTAVGPCWTAMQPPSLVDMMFAPIGATLDLAEAASCPTLAASSALLLGTSATAYLAARLGRSFIR